MCGGSCGYRTAEVILKMIPELSLQASKTEGCQWKVMAGQPLDYKGIEQFLYSVWDFEDSEFSFEDI